jgi:hypothetical protein
VKTVVWLLPDKLSSIARRLLKAPAGKYGKFPRNIKFLSSIDTEVDSRLPYLYYLVEW